jgi:ubiquinone/menaquinone biosynthesis C-methylase UbiE
MTAKLENLDAGQILDVATGGGNFLKYLIDTVSNYSEATGIDTKEAAASPFLKTFEQNPKVHYLTMAAEKMDFLDSSFDTVSISNSLHHLEDPERILREMLRVLKPSGTLIINEMYRDCNQTPAQQTHVLLHHWWAAVDRTQNVIHKETFTRQELVDFAAHLALEQIEVEDQIKLESDPMDPEVFNELDPVIQRYIERGTGNEELQKQGKLMLERLQSIGFHSASSLLLIARKK